MHLNKITLFVGLFSILLFFAEVNGQNAAVQSDWESQDSISKYGYSQVINKILPLLPADSQSAIRKSIGTLSSSDTALWKAQYYRTCHNRRVVRLSPHLSRIRQIVITRLPEAMGGSHYAYTDALSDDYSEFVFKSNTQLSIVTLNNYYSTEKVYLRADRGVVRDPDVSFDGKRVLFSWKQSARQDDFHLYELNVTDSTYRQLTSGLGHADYEGIYLPGGNIIFNSTRCMQWVDCYIPPVANFYLCNKDGKYMRRVGYDQVHTNYPALMSDGTIVYTRWEYNDRGQIYPQQLFSMYPDGTNQTAYYGNSCWFPTSILHARCIPGTQKVLAIISGHHTKQKGKLGLVDPSKGRQENEGVMLVAPLRKPDAVRVDQYGQGGEQFAYPYPISDSTFLVSYAYETNNKSFNLFWMNMKGEREYLINGLCQPAPLSPRPEPQRISARSDWRQTTAKYRIEDVYHGLGLPGVARGTVKKIRVIALRYRNGPPTGRLTCSGAAGVADQYTPIACSGGSWDVKEILGDATVYSDGSAYFTVPARTPIYFQCLDDKGRAIQTMRSWSTLMPGEEFSCVGCHEDKMLATPIFTAREALRQGPKPLQPFYGTSRTFSFSKEIQPILDSKCISCHEGSKAFDLRSTPILNVEVKKSFPISYNNLIPRTKWIHAQSVPTLIPPYFTGSTKTKWMDSLLIPGRHRGVTLSTEEIEKLAAWIDLAVPCFGAYDESMSDVDRANYRSKMEKKLLWDEQERLNINEFVATVPVSLSLSPRIICSNKAITYITTNVTSKINFINNYNHDVINILGKTIISKKATESNPPKVLNRKAHGLFIYQKSID